MFRTSLLLLVCLGLAVALTVTAIPSFAAEATPPMLVLRGSQPAQVRPSPQSTPLSEPSRDVLDDPRTGGFSLDPAPRVGGLASSRQGGGAQCRQSCAQEYYFCLSGQLSDDCGQSWGQCLRRCPSVSSDRY